MDALRNGGVDFCNDSVGGGKDPSRPEIPKIGILDGNEEKKEKSGER